MEEDIKILEEFLCTSHLSFGDATRCALALRRIKDRYRELEKENKKLNNANKTYINSIQSIAPVLMADYIEKSKIKEIVDECIPKGKNIITGEEEYQPNTNPNSFLTQSILELMED